MVRCVVTNNVTKDLLGAREERRARLQDGFYPATQRLVVKGGIPTVKVTDSGLKFARKFFRPAAARALSGRFQPFQAAFDC